MKRSVALLLCLGVGLGGCAAMQQGSEPEASSDIDYGKVALVEKAAAQSGVRVYWMNYPRKKHDG